MSPAFGLASRCQSGDDVASLVPSSARPLTEKLKQAYAATTFTARLPGGELRLRVGGHHPELDALLEGRGLLEWAYITAHNPGSVPTDPVLNAQAHGRLMGEVARRGFECYEGSGIPDDPGWLPERSVLILGIPEKEALVTGARFGQLAIVVGTRGEPARLVASFSSDGDDGSEDRCG